MKLRVGSLCSGICAPEQAWRDLGWEFVFRAEIEPFPEAVAAHHFPNVPNLGDITKFKDWPDYAIDILVGGTPCVSFSVAGLRKGLADPRGNLALTFLAIAARYQPTWIVWENVPGVHSSWSDAAVRVATGACGDMESRARHLAFEAGLDAQTIGSCGGFEEVDQTSDFDCFIAGMEELGYGISTCVLDAQYFGVAQRRERVFVVGHIGGQWQRAAAVLFERACLSWDSPPRRKSRKGIAGSTQAGFGVGGEELGKSLGANTGGIDREDRHTLVCAEVIPIQEIGKRQSGTPMNGVGHGTAGDPMFTLQSTAVHGVCAFQASDYKSGAYEHGETARPLTTSADHSRSAPLIAFSAKDNGRDAAEDISPTLRACNHDQSHANAGWNVAVAHSLRADGFDASEDGTGRGTPIVPTLARCVATREGTSQDYESTTIIPCNYAVRRLTPRECERLQGFPDDWTQIAWNGKPDEQCPDGPRYKALGNSMAVPCLEWFGKRIALVHALK